MWNFHSTAFRENESTMNEKKWWKKEENRWQNEGDNKEVGKIWNQLNNCKSDMWDIEFPYPDNYVKFNK